jgi:2-polyprenyl-3-methyl-5-hydroxy-6-metoxy-1,4-benzoquinol methylase
MPRRRGIEILDQPNVDPALAERSLHDVALANALFGGTRAVLAELAPLWRQLRGTAILLDVGTGLGDIPEHAREEAAQQGITLHTVGLEATPELAGLSRARAGLAICADARRLPFANQSVDIVTCSQVLHHFFGTESGEVLAELNRVGRRLVVVSDLRRSRLAAAGIWLSSFALRFHPVSRHDGVVSVMRGFRGRELRTMVAEAIGHEPAVRHHFGYRVTATWVPVATAPAQMPMAESPR